MGIADYVEKYGHRTLLVLFVWFCSLSIVYTVGRERTVCEPITWWGAAQVFLTLLAVVSISWQASAENTKAKYE
jgi:hypothetical protein